MKQGGREGISLKVLQTSVIGGRGLNN